VANLPTGVIFQSIEGDTIDSSYPLATALAFVPGLIAIVQPDKSIDIEKVS
jgi:hypothetical protein